MYPDITQPAVSQGEPQYGSRELFQGDIPVLWALSCRLGMCVQDCCAGYFAVLQVECRHIAGVWGNKYIHIFYG